MGRSLLQNYCQDPYQMGHMKKGKDKSSAVGRKKSTICFGVKYYHIFWMPVDMFMVPIGKWNHFSLLSAKGARLEGSLSTLA